MYRMTGDHRVRMYVDREQESLPAMAECYVIPQGATVAEERETRNKYIDILIYPFVSMSYCVVPADETHSVIKSNADFFKSWATTGGNRRVKVPSSRGSRPPD